MSRVGAKGAESSRVKYVNQSFLKILGSFLSLTRGSRNSKLHVAVARLRAESGDVCGKDERVSVAGGCCRGPNKTGDPLMGRQEAGMGCAGQGNKVRT